MTSFMAIGRNSVFPDFLSSKSNQPGHATPAYQESHESGLEGFKQKTLRLFGNNNNTQKSSSSSKSHNKGSPVSSNKLYQSSSQAKSSSNGNGSGGSRNIYRQPASLNNRMRNQTADLRRKYFSQRMMWYSEADEDQLEQEFARGFDRRHHSALELGSVSHANLLRSDSTQSSNSSQESIDFSQGSRRSRPPAVLKSASLDFYDGPDCRDSKIYRDVSPSPNRGRRASSSGVSSLRPPKMGTLQRQRSRLRTRFNDDVAVIYYDQEDKATAVSGSDSIRDQEKLKDDKTSSSNVTESTIRLPCTLHPGQSCGHSNLARILAHASTTDQSDTKMDRNDNDMTTPPITSRASDKLSALGLSDSLDAEGNMVKKAVFANKSFEIVPEEEGSYELKLVVPIGPEYIRNRTSVKATSGGKRLIVIAYRNQGEGDDEHVHQYIEKMTLPHPIDAYSVRATMDRDGNLKISAPMSILSDQNTSEVRSPSAGADPAI